MENRTQAGISLCQHQYTLKLLEDTEVLAGNPATTLMDPTLTLSDGVDEPIEDVSLCRRLIGRFLYLTISRPDITYSVHKLSPFFSQPHSIIYFDI